MSNSGGLFDRLGSNYKGETTANNRADSTTDSRGGGFSNTSFGYQEEENRGFSNEQELSSFVKTTYQLFAASLLAGSAGAWLGTSIAPFIKSIYWLLVIVELGLIFGLNFVRNKPGINLIVLFAFTFISGLTLAPLLVSILSLKGGGAIVTNAFLMTSVAFGGLSLFAMQTKRDFTSIGKILFIVLIVVVVGSIANIFLHSPILQLIIAMVSAILFSVFILYDTQNIINGGYDSAVSAAASLYLNFLNLFTSLLQILGILGSSDD